MRHFLAGLLAIVVAGVTGCTTHKAFERPAKLPTVGILQIESPDTYSYWDFNPVAAQFGLIGGAANGISSDIRRKRLTKILNEQQFHYGTMMTREIDAALRAAGYQTTLVSTVDRKKRDEWLKHYSHLQTDADCILDVATVFVGHVTHYGILLDSQQHPGLVAKVRLVERGTGKLLYAHEVSFSKEEWLGATLHMEYPEELAVRQDFDNAVQDEQWVVSSLTRATQAVAKQIGDDLQ